MQGSGWMKPGAEAELCIDGWAGFRAVPSRIVSLASGRAEIELAAPAVLPGGRSVSAGDTAMVPQSALRQPEGRKGDGGS